MQKRAQMSANEEKAGKNEWVSFEEEHEVPLLPQPPPNYESMNSERYIDFLEQKLSRIKNPSNVTSKNIVSGITEARESQMNNFLNQATDECNASSSHAEDHLHWDKDVGEPRCCCSLLYNHLFPQQAKTIQEVECLLDEDELAIVNSESVDESYLDQHSAPT